MIVIYANKKQFIFFEFNYSIVQNIDTILAFGYDHCSKVSSRFNSKESD